MSHTGATAGSTLTAELVDSLRTELATLENPKARAVNESRGDDHGVNLSALRSIATRLGAQPELAKALWDTADSAARLLSILISRPKFFTSDDLDRMLRESRAPKVHTWLVQYLVKKGPHAEELRQRWITDANPIVASAGWLLTSERARKSADGLDLPGLLDIIDATMFTAPERLQWAMNQCLAEIGISHPELRERAISIGERWGVLKDYPTPPNCTSPYAPIWIREIVHRNTEKAQ